MDERLASELSNAVDRDSRAAIRCLAAAERAVEEGRFNTAKVLRAAAHSARVRAMNLQRLLATQELSLSVLRAERERWCVEQGAFDSILALARPPEGAAFIDRLQHTLLAGKPLVEILDRAVASVRSHRDVMESDVAQSLWGCHDCGQIVEGDRPDVCPHCGALGPELEWFGPFYAETTERLGRRRPEEIVAILSRNPDELAQSFKGASEEVLARRPSANEWSMKEIAGHMLDVTERFCQCVRMLQESSSPPALDFRIPAWKVLEGKGYPEILGGELVSGFRGATAEALAIILQLDRKDWVRQGTFGGRATNILDLGAWLSNHNIAHLKQIEALRELFTR